MCKDFPGHSHAITPLSKIGTCVWPTTNSCPRAVHGWPMLPKAMLLVKLSGKPDSAQACCCCVCYGKPRLSEQFAYNLPLRLDHARLGKLKKRSRQMGVGAGTEGAMLPNGLLEPPSRLPCRPPNPRSGRRKALGPGVLACGRTDRCPHKCSPQTSLQTQIIVRVGGWVSLEWVWSLF